MMSESIDSRKFERKAVFDIPLPMKRSAREGAGAENAPEPVAAPAQSPPAQHNTMAFSLMTKKGNKQQVCPPSTCLKDMNDMMLILPITNRPAKSTCRLIPASPSP